MNDSHSLLLLARYSISSVNAQCLLTNKTPTPFLYICAKKSECPLLTRTQQTNNNLFNGQFDYSVLVGKSTAALVIWPRISIISYTQCHIHTLSIFYIWIQNLDLVSVIIIRCYYIALLKFFVLTT